MDCGFNPGTIVLADGRVIRRGASGMEVRQLAPAGMQQIRDAVDATGLFDASATYQPVMNPGKESGGFGPQALTFELGSGAGAVRVESSELSPFLGDNQRSGNVWTIPKEAYVLDELAAKLLDLDMWLPPEAWDGPAGTFVPEHYLLFVASQHEAGEVFEGTSVDAVRWPFPVPIVEVGDAYVEPGGSEVTAHCLVMTRRTAEAMAAAEAAVPEGGRGLQYPFDSRSYVASGGDGMVDVTTRMVMPHRAPSCLGAGEW